MTPVTIHLVKAAEAALSCSLPARSRKSKPHEPCRCRTVPQGHNPIDAGIDRDYPEPSPLSEALVRFDPAIAAQTSFKLAVESGQLDADVEAVRDAEATFSATAGEEAHAAYLTLQEIGIRYPQAASFQAFLIYITWQQVMEETIPTHFRQGIVLCDRYLQRAREAAQDHDTTQVEQIRELRVSFCSGLGLADKEASEEEHDKDAFTGGD